MMCFTYHNMDANIVSHNMDVVRPENEPMLAKAKAEEQAEEEIQRIRVTPQERHYIPIAPPLAFT